MKLIFFISNILLKIKRTKPRYKAVQQIKTYNYKIQTTLKEENNKHPQYSSTNQTKI